MSMDKLVRANYFYVFACDVVYSTRIGHSVIQKGLPPRVTEPPDALFRITACAKIYKALLHIQYLSFKIRFHSKEG